MSLATRRSPRELRQRTPEHVRLEAVVLGGQVIPAWWIHGERRPCWMNDYLPFEGIEVIVRYDGPRRSRAAIEARKIRDRLRYLGYRAQAMQEDPRP